MIETLGRYKIDAELGQGAMGTVYKARDPLLDRTVAIKTISLNLPKEEVAEYEARFYQEAKAAGQLSHPNIVTIYDIGKSEDLAYMAMEYLEGQELRELLGATPPIPIEQALDIGAQVAEALHYAHEREIVHRDVKPGNVMVLNDGQVKITDFGIARMRNNEVKTMTGMILGSPKYMSPEQVAGKRADQRSDIFSLGVVVYEMLTGTSPFIADNIHGVMYQTLNFDPPAPKTLNPDLPAVINYIIAKALAKNLDERYQSAKDLANDLRQACAEFIGSATDTELVASIPGQRHPFVEPSAPLTRVKDKDALATRVHEDSESDRNGDSERDPAAGNEEKSGPALSLSTAFDSFDATMRLAAITDMEHYLDEYSDTQKVQRLKMRSEAKRSAAASSPSNGTSWRNDTAAAHMAGTGDILDRKLRYVWIGNAGLILATIFVFIFA